MRTIVTFDSINDSSPYSGKSVNCAETGWLVGATLRKVQGTKHALDTLVWTLRIFATDETQNYDYIVFEAEITAPDYDQTIPLSVDKLSLCKHYVSEYHYNSGAGQSGPQLYAVLSVSGMNNIPVLEYIYKIALETVNRL